MDFLSLFHKQCFFYFFSHLMSPEFCSWSSPFFFILLNFQKLLNHFIFRVKFMLMTNIFILFLKYDSSFTIFNISSCVGEKISWRDFMFLNSILRNSILYILASLSDLLKVFLQIIFQHTIHSLLLHHL